MTSKLKTDVIETVSGSGTIALANQFSGMTYESVPALTSAHMPSGSVLQAVNVYSNASVSTSSTALLSLNTLTVTPVGTGSRFVINWFLQGTWGNTNQGFGAYMYRDGVEVGRSGNTHSVYTNTLADAYLGGAWSVVDGSGSTAGVDITFELRAQSYKNVVIQYSGSTQTRGFVILEIAA